MAHVKLPEKRSEDDAKPEADRKTSGRWFRGTQGPETPNSNIHRDTNTLGKKEGRRGEAEPLIGCPRLRGLRAGSLGWRAMGGIAENKGWMRKRPRYRKNKKVELGR